MKVLKKDLTQKKLLLHQVLVKKKITRYYNVGDYQIQIKQYYGY